MRSTRPVPTAPRARAAVLLVSLVLAALGVLLVAPAAQASTSGTTPSASTRSTASARLSPLAVPRCTAYSGARALGTSYTDAYVRIDACGQRPSFDGTRSGGGSRVLPYAGAPVYYSGYQCIEIVARYLKARFDANAGVANGAAAVDRYASVYPSLFVRVANGTRGMAPRKGDVLSLSSNRRFDDVGHTGIVSSSSIDAAGNGTIRAVEQNWGGAGGASGYHTYPVKKWSVVFAGLPHVKWLRAR